MDSIQNLKTKAQKCLAKKAEMPMSPVFNMAKVAISNASGDLKYLQDAIDFLTCKAKAKMDFNEDEKEFLKELYEAFWWGGRYKGYKEAAKLADYYVNGDGNPISNPLRINPEVYQTSKIVIATMAAMKKFIIEKKDIKKSFFNFRCDNAEFMSKKYVKSLRNMNYKTEGKMKSTGVLEAAQDNQRLHKTDGHFHLEALSVLLPTKKIRTTWRVDSLYDFEPFEKHDYYTHIPLGEQKLVISDGLSEYMTRIGVAKSFWYRAEWVEIWDPS
jgi:hypothetical protein